MGGAIVEMETRMSRRGPGTDCGSTTPCSPNPQPTGAWPPLPSTFCNGPASGAEAGRHRLTSPGRQPRQAVSVPWGSQQGSESLEGQACHCFLLQFKYERMH